MHPSRTPISPYFLELDGTNDKLVPRNVFWQACWVAIPSYTLVQREKVKLSEGQIRQCFGSNQLVYPLIALRKSNVVKWFVLLYH